MLRGIHADYLAAGADIILTCTFGGSRLKLPAGIDVTPFNRTMARIARAAVDAAGREAFVAGDMGPCGQFVRPLGDLHPLELYEALREQARGLVEGGVDLFLIETQFDLAEVRIAVAAIRAESDLPIMVSMTFEQGTSLTGTTPEIFAETMQNLGVDALGLNCGLGPEQMAPLMERFLACSSVPVLAEPNAGLPELYAFDYMSHEKHLSMFWSFFTVSFGVTLGVAFAGNMMTMYLFYELLTLATLPLVMQPMSTTARKAGVKYAVYSMSGAALAFIGLVFLVVNDAQDFTLGGHLAGYTGDRQLLLAVFVLAFVGFGVKAAIWPLHAWLPAAAVAPTPVTALLHAVAVVKSGAFACIRLIYYAFGTEILVGTWAQQAVMTLTLITILFASCMSVKQRHFKRRLAYSTVSNLSYILFAATIMTLPALTAAFLHLIVHSVVKILAFFTAGAVLHYSHREYVHQLEGLGKRMPVTFVCYTVAACALTGVPPFTGFVSKWYIALAAVDTYQPLPIIGFGVLLVSALLTAIYMFQIAVRAWFPRHSAPAIPEGSVHEAGWQMLVPMVVLAAACLLMGLMPQGLLDLIREAVTL